MQPWRALARLRASMKLLIALVLATGLASLPVRQAAACSCARFGPQEAAASADAVFAGTVVDREVVGFETGPLGATAATAPVPAPFGQVLFTFEVDGVAKGDVGSLAQVLTSGDDGMCGTSFGNGERWLVFTTWDGDVHRSGLCSGNILLGRDGEAPLPLTAPSDDGPPLTSGTVPWGMIALLGVIGLVIVTSWLAFRREPATSTR